MSTKSALLETLAPFGVSASTLDYLDDQDIPKNASERRQRVLDTINRTYLPRRIELVCGDARLGLLVSECQVVGVSEIKVPSISDNLTKVLVSAKIWKKPPPSLRKDLLKIFKKGLIEFVKVPGALKIDPQIVDDTRALPKGGFTLIELGYKRPEAEILHVDTSVNARPKSDTADDNDHAGDEPAAKAAPVETSPYGGVEKLEIRKGGLAEQYFESTAALSGSAFLLNGKGEVAAARNKNNADFPEESGTKVIAGFQNWATLLSNELPGPHQIIVRSYRDEGDCYSVLWDGEAMSINSFKDEEISRVINSWLIARRDQVKV